MGNLEKISLLDSSKLSGEFYLSSLFEASYNCKLLSDKDAQKIQLSCLNLLASKTEEYTGGESSSVPTKIAEQIMKSNFYTVGIYLKSLSSLDNAIKNLTDLSITELYAKGRKLIDTKIKSAKYYYMLVRKNMLKTENYTYNSTLIGGISCFFKLYSPDFSAHEIHITMDYPLCNRISDLVGIEFIQKYLESIKLENDFSLYFNEHAVHHLLCGYNKNYKELIFNIFELLLSSALGCTLANLPVRELSIGKDKLDLLSSLFTGKSKTEIVLILQNAAKKMFDILELTSLSLQKYIMTSLNVISENIVSAMISNRLEDVFIESEYQENNPRIYVSFGNKTDDENYRNIIDDILKCKTSSDKIAIIRQEIHSLADLEDLFLDAELDNDELAMVFNDLQPAEIAAFIKRNPFDEDGGIYKLGENENRLCTSLHSYVLSLPNEKQDLINKAVSYIVIDDD